MIVAVMSLWLPDPHYDGAVWRAVATFLPMALLSWPMTSRTGSGATSPLRIAAMFAIGGLLALAFDLARPNVWLAAFGLMMLLSAGECAVVARTTVSSRGALRAH